MIVAALSDTHIPDRIRRLPERAMEVLGDSSVEAILHAGDICRPGVLHELSRIAPVVAVRGNRDILWPGNWRLPARRVVEFGETRIGLTHGHPGLGAYILRRLMPGHRTPEATERRVARRFPHDVSAIVYGHSHIPRVTRLDGILMVNPGSLAPEHYTDLGATLALLKITEGSVEAEIMSVSQSR
jgi:putative phosphoesterase